MSGRRSRSRQGAGQYPSSGGGASTISEEQIRELVSKLQQLLPELHARRRSDRVSAAKVLQETCNYIQSLQREVDNLSERLGELLETNDSAEAALIRSLLSQQR